MYCKNLAKTICLFLLLMMVASNVTLVEATTWSASINRVTTQIQYDGYPAITQMADGKIWLLWSKDVAGNLSIYYKTSPDLGNTWSDEMNLTKVPASGYDQNPSIIQAVNGTIWMVWSSTRPSYQPPFPNFNLAASPPSLTIPQAGSDTSNITVTSIDDFSDTVTLSVSGAPPNVFTTLDPTQVAPPPNGTANSTLTVSVEATATPGNYTLEVMGRSGKIIRTVNIALEITPSGGSNMGHLTQTSTHARAEPSATQDYEIYFKTSHDNGATWSTANQLTDDASDDLQPSIVQLSNGTIMLVWQGYSLSNDDIYYMTTTDGTSWSDPLQLTTDSELDNAPDVTRTEDGRILVVWASRRTGIHEIYIKIYDGVSWSSDTRLTYSSNSDVTPAILQTVDDTIWIWWSSCTTTSDNDIYYMSSSDNGASWSESIQFTTDGNEDVSPEVTQASDTKILVYWASDRADQPYGNWDVYYRTSLAGDVNEDGIVDIHDLSQVSMAYGCFSWEPCYDPDADINKDGVIDMRDLTIISINYGAT